MFGKRSIAVVSLVLPLIITIMIITVMYPNTRSMIKESVNVNKNAENSVTEIRFLSSWGGVDAYSDTLNFVLNKFEEENKDISVVNESLFGDDFLVKVQTDFASGNSPDVFGLWPGSIRDLLIKNSKMADITDVLNSDIAWKNSFYPDMWRYVTYNGRVYGVPFEIIMECLFINKDIFERYNLQVPQDFNQLKEVCKKLRNYGVIPIAFNSQPEGTYIYQNIIVNLGEKQEVENPLHSNKVTLPYLKGLEYLKDLYKIGAFPDNYYTLSSKQRNDLFLKKKAAMIVQGSWFFSKCDPKTVEIVFFPKIHKTSSKSLIYGLGGGTFYISNLAWRDSKKKAASIKLLKFLTSEENARIFVERTGLIPNVKLSGMVKIQNPLRSKAEGLIKEASELVGPPDHFIDRNVWDNVIARKIPYVFEGKMTSQQLWNEAIQKWNESLIEMGKN